MTPDIVIREETSADIDAIASVTVEAFKTLEISNHTEQFIGKALIRAGLARLQARHARGCCLVGHPGYYRQFGFANAPGLALEGVPSEVFFALAFDGRMPQGSVAFHVGFMADA